jgi:hypothetical protein
MAASGDEYSMAGVWRCVRVLREYWTELLKASNGMVYGGRCARRSMQRGDGRGSISELFARVL